MNERDDRVLRAADAEVSPRERARLERAARRHEFGRPPVTEVEIGSTTHRVAQEVQPLDTDGVRTMTVGTIVWGVVAVGMIPFFGTLDGNGRVWWLWTAIAGFGLGLIGIEYCRRRRRALQMRPGRRKA